MSGQTTVRVETSPRLLEGEFMSDVVGSALTFPIPPPAAGTAGLTPCRRLKAVLERRGCRSPPG